MATLAITTADTDWAKAVNQNIKVRYTGASSLPGRGRPCQRRLRTPPRDTFPWPQPPRAFAMPVGGQWDAKTGVTRLEAGLMGTRLVLSACAAPDTGYTRML